MHETFMRHMPDGWATLPAKSSLRLWEHCECCCVWLQVLAAVSCVSGAGGVHVSVVHLAVLCLPARRLQGGPSFDTMQLGISCQEGGTVMAMQLLGVDGMPSQGSGLQNPSERLLHVHCTSVS